MEKVFPVIIKIPEKTRALKGKELVASLSDFARKSLLISAEKSGTNLKGELLKDEKGAPIPVDGVFWSLSHKPKYAAGVTATYPIGIDIEKIRSYQPRLKNKIARKTEWDLGGDESPEVLLFRYWTAKESVLKATGQGLTGLSSCRVEEVLDKKQLVLVSMKRKWLVEHFYFEDHIASIVKGKGDVIWSVL